MSRIKLVNILGFTLCSLVVFAIQSPGHWLSPLEIGTSDNFGECHRGVVKARHKLRIDPLAMAVGPAAIGPLDEVVTGLAVFDVIGGIRLHLGAEVVGRREHVVNVSVANARDDRHLLICRNLSAPERVDVDADVNDNAESVVLIRVGIGEKRNAERSCKVSLQRTNFGTRLPSSFVPLVFVGCHGVPFRFVDGMWRMVILHLSACQSTSEIKISTSNEVGIS